MNTAKTPPLTLEGSRKLRFFTLCVLYFAQGVPWGFVTIALVAFLSERGVSIAETGALTALAGLPWTFKVLWGPLIDSFALPAFGRRRPWIVLAQACMAATLLIGFSTADLTSEATIGAIGAILFAHNCFASLQDVATDALAIDVLLPDERGKANGMMWGSKLAGVSFGGAGMAALMINTNIEVAMQVMAGLMLLIVLVPLFVLERPSNRRFPWSKGEAVADGPEMPRPRPLAVVKDLFRAFRTRATFLGLFVALFCAVGAGLCRPLNAEVFVQRIGWTAETYSYATASFGLAGKLLAAIAGGVLCDRFGAQRVFTWGVCLCAVVLGSFAVTADQWTHVGYPLRSFIFALEGSMALVGVAALTTFMKLSWTKAAATQFTLYMTVTNVGSTVATTLAMSGLPHETLYLIAAAGTLVPLGFLPFIQTESIERRRKIAARQDRAWEEAFAG